MNKTITMAIIALFAASCSNEYYVNVVSDEKADDVLVPVTVHLDGFSVSMEDYVTRTDPQNVADYTGVNAVTLAFYKTDGTEAYKHVQLKSDNTTFTTFGEFSLSLPMGSYTMVAVAYYNSEASPLVLTSPTAAAYTGTRAYETFAKSQDLVISNTDAVNVSATLDRIASQLKVVSTDGKTADVSNVRMTFSAGGKSFNPSTGLATVNTGFSNTVSNSAAVGATSTSLSFLFLATDEQTMDVTIETLDADGNTIFSKTVSDVPFKRNRITKLTGAMYTNAGTSGSFQLNTDWLTETSIAF